MNSFKHCNVPGGFTVAENITLSEDQNLPIDIILAKFGGNDKITLGIGRALYAEFSITELRGLARQLLNAAYSVEKDLPIESNKKKHKKRVRKSKAAAKLLKAEEIAKETSEKEP